jgi:DNA-binding IscR family transcriptional regulator
VKVNEYFDIVLNIMIRLVLFRDTGSYKVVRDFVGSSVNNDPDVICAAMVLLKMAGLIEIAEDTRIKLLREPKEISLLDIYNAVRPLDKRKRSKFQINSTGCHSLGGRIYSLLTRHSAEKRAELENVLGKVSLEQVTESI